VNYVRDQILAAFQRFTETEIDRKRLDATRSRMRYGFAIRMDSSEAIASALAPYVSLRRTPETINKLFDTYAGVTPKDIRDAAKKYFRDDSRTVVTLAPKGMNLAALGQEVND
jgi:zinc protease